MKILSIETSCDETAIALIEAQGGIENPDFTIIANELYSQASKHAEYGGVYPTLAKREHALNLTPLLQKISAEASLSGKPVELTKAQEQYITELLKREPDMAQALLGALGDIHLEEIDIIAVTQGPGLEPALWVGINFAKTLSYIWNIPLVPVNHMEGHIFSTYIDAKPEYPLLSLLISGGHTQLVLSKEPFQYQIIGETRDDAVGEAYDKVARMLNLGYPGGPAISQKAQEARKNNIEGIPLPRPMIDSPDLDFSFSGLKTATLYAVRECGALSDDETRAFARGFEDAVTDVLKSKITKAMRRHEPKSLIVAGGVSANTHIREALTDLVKNESDICKVFFPTQDLSTDNAIMIGIVGYMKHNQAKELDGIHAQGNLSLENNS